MMSEKTNPQKDTKEGTYDVIYKHIMNVIDSLLDTMYSNKAILNTIAELVEVREPIRLQENTYCSFAVDGSMGYVTTPSFVVYTVRGAAVPMNISERSKIAENTFLMIPSRNVKDRVLTKMSTLEAFMGLLVVERMSNVEDMKKVLLVDGLITTPIYVVLRNLYSRLHIHGDMSTKEDLRRVMREAYGEIKKHWELIVESFKGDQLLTPNKERATLFYSEGGKYEVLKKLHELILGIREEEKISYEKDNRESTIRDAMLETALFVLESVENLVLRDLLLERARENSVAIIGIAKSGFGYSLRGFLRVIRNLKLSGETSLKAFEEDPNKVFGMTDMMLVIGLIGEKDTKYIYSPLFHAYYEEPRTLRIYTTAEILKDPFKHVSDVARIATEITRETRKLKDLDSVVSVLKDKTLEREFYVGYARFASYQRPYKFEVLANGNSFEDLMNWLYSMSISGYPEPLKLADTLSHRPKRAMSGFYGVLMDFIKKYSKHSEHSDINIDIILRQIMEPYRSHLPSRGGSFES